MYTCCKIKKKHVNLLTSCLIGASISTMISPDSYIKTAVTIMLFIFSIVVCFLNDKLVKNTGSGHLLYRHIGMVYAIIFGVIFSQFFNINTVIKDVTLIFCLIAYFVFYRKIELLNK